MLALELAWLLASFELDCTGKLVLTELNAAEELAFELLAAFEVGCVDELALELA